MKRLVAFILTIILLGSQYNMTSLAAATYPDCIHKGNVVTASETGYIDIVFSNGYRGFCINYGDHEATEGHEFTIDNMSLAVNNNTNENISQYLKVMLVDYFDTFFDIDEDTNTCSLKDKLKTQHYIWHFSDDFSGWRVDPDLVNAIKNATKNRTESIPDHGYTVKVNNTTQAVFDFHVLKAGMGTGYQNFFTYKVTLIPYPKPEFTSPTTTQTVEVVWGQEIELSVTATGADTYQWQVDKGDGNGFVNIENANDTTYKPSAVTAENIGYQYQCIAINTAGNTNSPIVSLKLKAPAFVVPTENTKKVENVTAENVKPEDKDDLEKAKADFEKALVDNSDIYTKDEKRYIKDEIKRIDDALKMIGNIKKEQEEISKPVDKEIPQTGDSLNMSIWFTLMISSLAMIYVIVFDAKKKRSPLFIYGRLW